MMVLIQIDCPFDREVLYDKAYYYIVLFSVG